MSNLIKYLPHRRMAFFQFLAVFCLIPPWVIYGKTATVSVNTPESGRVCQVASIYDGDTMRVICDGERTKLRLICIDAPEMQQRPWGKEARDHLRAMATSSVRVVGNEKDRYGRTIAEAWTHDTQENLNLAMVRSGKAVVYPKYCKEQQYYQAQEEAQSNAVGIWEKPGNWQRPWEYRKAKRNKG